MSFCCVAYPLSLLQSCAVCLVAQLCLTTDPMDCSLRGSPVQGDFPGKNSEVGCHALHHRIFPTQGMNSHLLHCMQILYCLSHQGSPRILKWVAYPFSRGFSQPRNRTGVSWIAGRFFTSWTTREATAHLEKVRPITSKTQSTFPPRAMVNSKSI